jgi:hypothetical protein
VVGFGHNWPPLQNFANSGANHLDRFSSRKNPHPSDPTLLSFDSSMEKSTVWFTCMVITDQGQDRGILIGKDWEGLGFRELKLSTNGRRHDIQLTSDLYGTRTQTNRVFGSLFSIILVTLVLMMLYQNQHACGNQSQCLTVWTERYRQNHNYTDDGELGPVDGVKNTSGARTIRTNTTTVTTFDVEMCIRTQWQMTG